MTAESGGIFNIGSQQAGVVNNVAGDQTVHDGRGSLDVEVSAALEQLRAGVREAPLTAPERGEAEAALSAAESHLDGSEGDRRSVASRLEQLTSLLTRTGALVSGARDLREPLRTLAGWLGTAGSGILGSLPG